MLSIEMTIWDNTINTMDKNAILLFCERALLKVWREQNNGCAAIKITNRAKSWFIAEVPLEGERAIYFMHNYNRKLNHLHYWREVDEQGDERLIMEYQLKKDA